MNEDLKNYILEQLSTGVDEQILKKRLLDAGWDENSIDQAFPKSRDKEIKIETSESSSSSRGLSGPVELLKKSWEFYKKNFKKLTLILLIPVLANAILGFLLALASAAGVLALNVSLFQRLGSSQTIIWFVVFGVILFIIFLLLQALGQTALLVAVTKNYDVRASFKKGLTILFPYLWVMFLSAIIVGGGLVLFVIPGMIFSIWFSLDIFVLADEGVGGMGALLKSKNYVEGRWWATLGRILFIGILTLIVLSVPASIFEKLNLQILATFYSVLGSLIWVPILLIYNYLLYKNLKETSQEKEIKKSSKIIFLIIGLFGLAIPLLAMIILATLSPNKTLQKAKDAQRESNGKMVINALDYYYADSGVYPGKLEELSPDYISSDLLDLFAMEDFDYQVLNDGQIYQFCINYQEKEQECLSPPPRATPQ